MKRSLVYIAIGFSLLLSGLPKPVWAQIPSAETNAAPAAASLGGVDYVAWKGKAASKDTIWYATLSSTQNGGTGEWSSQQQISWTIHGSKYFANTTQAPALATAGNTVFLAWRGASPNPTDEIYYSTNTGSGWKLQQTVCGSNCATTVAPALAATCQSEVLLGTLGRCSLPIYMAWTESNPITEENTIEVASNTGSGWTLLPSSSQPTANPYPGTAPALAVYGDQLFLAWVQEGTTCDVSPCFQVMYETYSLSDDAWTSPATATTASSSVVPVAPALDVYVTTDVVGQRLSAQLDMAWWNVVSPSGAELDYGDWDDGSSPPNWGTPLTEVPIPPPLPVPPGPLTPALVYTVSTPPGSCTVTSLTFSVVYAENVPDKSYYDIYFDTTDEGALFSCPKGTT
jgi:hypothetical protein